MKKSLFIAWMLLLPLVASASDPIKVSIDGINYTLNIDNNTATVTGGYPNEAGVMIIPNKVDLLDQSYRVTSVESRAFKERTDILSLTIQKNIEVGMGAFEDCTGLTTLTLYAGVSLSWSAFDNCTALTTINDYAGFSTANRFSDCTAIRTINYHCETVSSRFNGSSLTNITIGPEVRTIGDGVFGGCSKLSSIDFSEGVTTIGKNAFSNCPSLTSIDLPESVTAIGESAFESSIGLTSISIPQSVTTISQKTFYGCTGLTSVDLPEGVTTISQNAFYGCTGLTSVDLPKNVTTVGESAFYGCTGLISISFPQSVTTIGNKVFYGCTSLSSVSFPQNLESIPDLMFYGCESLVNFPFTNSLKSIGVSAFDHCKGPAILNIPASVTSIGKYAFSSCSGILSVYTGDGMTEVPETFQSIPLLIIAPCVTKISNPYNYGGQKVVWLPETPPEGYQYFSSTIDYVKNDQYTERSNKIVYPQLGARFVSGGVIYVPISNSTCEAISCTYDENCTNIVIPKTVNSGGGILTVEGNLNLLCYKNPYLQEVTVNADVDWISGSFSGCPSLKKVTIGDSDKKLIIHSAFEDTEGIETFYLGRNTYFYPEIFNAPALKSFIVGDCVTDLNLGFNSKELIYLELGRNLYTLNASFAECTGLTQIVSKASFPPICGENVFSSTTKQNCDLLVPDDCVTVYLRKTVWKDFGTVKAGGFLGNHALIDHVWYRIIPNSTTAEVFELDDYNYTGNIVIPELISYDRNSYTVTTIRKKAFYESRVTSIEIPKTITSIGSLAFAQYCTRYNMTSIICHMEKPIDVEEGTFGYVDEDYKGFMHVYTNNATLYVPAGKKELFAANENWNHFKDITDEYDGEVVIDGLRFRIIKANQSAHLYRMNRFESEQSSYLKNPAYLVVPETITDGKQTYTVRSLCDEMCRDCGYDLVSLRLPNTIKRIGEQAFYNGSGVVSVNIPTGLEEFADYALAGSSVARVTIPATVKSIGEGAFNGNSLSSVISHLQNPFDVDESVFGKFVRKGRSYYYDTNDATLYVPKGTKAKYEALGGWNVFKDIKEFVIGDINDSGVADKQDVEPLAGAITSGSMEDINEGAADMNMDNIVDVVDVVLLINMVKP